MAERFSVYFAGQLLAGQQEPVVRANLARLFKADAAALEKLFSGQLVPVKRDCDRATAIKYQQAMKQAGAVPVIKELQRDNIDDKSAARPAAPTPAVSEPAPAEAPDKQLSMAERLAAITGEDSHASPDQGGQPAADHHAPGNSTGTEDTAYTLAPPHTPVLNPEERSSEPAAAVDTSSLELDPPTDRLSPPASPPPPAPDTSHLSVGDSNDGAATASVVPPPPALPDISALDLSAAGTDLSDCAPPPATPPALDLSGLELGPTGADVLEQRYRRSNTEKAPDTAHLSLTE